MCGCRSTRTAGWPGCGCTGGPWAVLLPRTRVQPDTRHQLPVQADEPVTHVRLDVFPDGGLARFRVHGELT